MSELEARAKTLTDDTLHRTTFRLNKIWKLWGPTDYPKDQGVAFRNELFLFADWMLYYIRQACSEAPVEANEWIARNATQLLSLSDEELMRCVGLCHIHMQAFSCHMHFLHNNSMLLDGTSVGLKLITFGRQLDWVYKVHDLPEEVAAASHALLAEHLGDEEYLEASSEQLGMYLDKTTLGWSEASSPKMWDYIACAADMSSKSQIDKDPVETQQFCDRVFAEL